MVVGSIAPFLTPEGAFVFTLTNNGYKRMTLNLIHHLRRAKVPWKLCVICADLGSYQFLRGQDVPCLKAANALPEFGPGPSPFGSKQFQTLNLKKLELLAKFVADPAVKIGIYMDGDIAVYSDFLPDILERFQAPAAPRLLMQCDEQTRVDCIGTSCPKGCTGFIAWSHGLSVEPFTVNSDPQLWKAVPEDQPFVNTMVRRLEIPFETLPRTLYPNGSFASLYGKSSVRKAITFLLHYNYLVGGAKEQKMKNNSDWIIPY